MKKILSVLLSVILIFACSGCAKVKIKQNDNQLTQKQKLSDFEYAYKILKENYPFFEVNKRLSGIDWLKNKNKYIEMIKDTKNNDDFLYTMNEILKELNNRHTQMLFKDGYNSFHDDFKDNDPRYEQLSKPKSINMYSKYSNDKSDINSNNKSNMNSNVRSEIIKNGEVAYLSIKSFYKSEKEDKKIITPFLNKIKNYKILIIDIRGNGGGDSSYWSDYLMPMIIDKTFYSTDYFAFRGGSLSDKFIKYDLGDDYKNLIPIKEIDKYNLKNIPPELKTDFKYFYKCNDSIHPDNDSIHFKGKIYLLTDNDVYSSAEEFAVFAKNSGFATIVGERTGGDGIGKTPIVYSLPNSGFILRFAYVMGLFQDGTCESEHKVTPDIEVDATQNPDLSKDIAIQKVLSLNNY